MSEKHTAEVSHLDSSEVQVKGVHNAALAVATIQQKPSLWSKSMLKVCHSMMWCVGGRCGC